MNPSLLACSLMLALSSVAAAQVNIGDIGVISLSNNSFMVLQPGMVAVTYTTGGFGPPTTAIAQSILHDPANPNDFIVGGTGFVGRCRITGPGTASYTVISNAVGTVVQMDWDANGQLIIGDGQVRRLDPMTGTIVDVTTGTQPWTTLNACAVDPATQDIVVGGLGYLYRVPFGTSTGIQIASVGGLVTGVTFDRLTSEVIATVSSGNLVVRVSAAGVVTPLVNNISVLLPESVAVDENGDVIVGALSRVHRVPRSGGSASTIGPTPGGMGLGVSVRKERGFAIAFGQGCAGAGGNVTITGTGPFATGSTLTSTSRNHAPGQLGVLLFGFSNAVHQSLPLPHRLDPLLGTSNCFLNASIDATVLGVATASTPADLTFNIALTSAFAGHQFYLQHACFEPVAGGMSWSPGQAVRIQ